MDDPDLFRNNSDLYVLPLRVMATESREESSEDLLLIPRTWTSTKFLDGAALMVAEATKKAARIANKVCMIRSDQIASSEGELN